MSHSASPNLSSLNEQIYERLKLALGLELRRQIFIAVCDDLALRNRLAAKLHTELAYPNPGLPVEPTELAASKGRGYPRLVSLSLNLVDPNPVAQVAQWLSQYPPPIVRSGPIQPAGRVAAPSFQILGVERLTRQPGTVQRLFLGYLENIERSLPTLESCLLLWMPQPWFRALQQSAPAFWSWHTGVFEFVSDLQTVSTVPPETDYSRTAANGVSRPPSPPTDLWDILSQDLAKLGENEYPDHPEFEGNHQSEPPQNQQPARSKPTRDRIPPSPPPSTPAQPTTPTRTHPPSKTAAPATQRGVLTLQAPKKAPATASVTEPAKTARLQSPAIAVAHPPQTQTPPSPLVDQRPILLSTSRALAELTHLILTDAVQEFGVAQGLQDELDDVWANNLIEQLTRAANHPQGLEAAIPPGLEESLQRFPPLQSLYHIEQLHQQEAPATELVTAYRNLGNFYRDRIEQGEQTPTHLSIAIRAYEQVLMCLEMAAHDHPNDALIQDMTWSDVLNDLGNLYWMFSRVLGSLEQKLPYLEQSIQAYHTALHKTDAEKRPHAYAMIQNNLGAAYNDLSRYRDPATNLQRAIAAYQESLTYRPADADAQKYAATQNNLGTAFWTLAQHQQPRIHLRQSILAYSEALKHYSPEEEPLHYAMIQNNLGTAYWNLAQYEQAQDLLLLAIDAYQTALQYRTPQTTLSGYAATQNNLGTAFWHLGNQLGEQPELRQQVLQQAIAAYQASLQAADQLPPTSLTFDLCATHNNLGLAHYQVATETKAPLEQPLRTQHLEAALQQQLTALEGWQAQPEFYQTALNYIVQTVRAFYNELGIKGQNLALSKVPSHLLPTLMPRI